MHRPEDFRTERGTFDDDLVITDRVRFEGRANKNVIVRQGGWLILEEIVLGNVIVEAGGIARLGGVIEGSVVNRGGNVVVKGWVRGTVIHEAGDETRLWPTSRVAGKVTPYPDAPPPPIAANENGSPAVAPIGEADE